MQDLFGVRLIGHHQPARLVLHQHWPAGWHPMRNDADPAPEFGDESTSYPFLEVEGTGCLRDPRRPRPRRHHRTRTLPVLGGRRDDHHDEGPTLVRPQGHRTTLPGTPHRRRRRARRTDLGRHGRRSQPRVLPRRRARHRHAPAGGRPAAASGPARTRAHLQPRDRHRCDGERRRLRDRARAHHAATRATPPDQRSRSPVTGSCAVRSSPVAPVPPRSPASPTSSRFATRHARSSTSSPPTRQRATDSPAPPPSRPTTPATSVSSATSPAPPASTSTPAATIPSRRSTTTSTSPCSPPAT